MEFLLQLITNWALPAVFFLLVFSFCTMIIVEMIDTRVQLRSKLIKKGIYQILGTKLAPRFLDNILVNPLGEKTTPTYIEPAVFANIIMLWVMRGSPYSEESQPALSIEQMRKNISLLDNESPHLGNLLKTLAAKTAFQTDSTQEFSTRLEESLSQWYSDAQNQIGSQYKRLVQNQLMVFGFLVALFANFDLIRMVSNLWKISLMKELVDLSQKTGQPIQIDVGLFNTLPLGWQPSEFAVFSNVFALLVKFLGISIGAFLIFIFAQYIYDFVKGRLTKFILGQN